MSKPALVSGDLLFDFHRLWAALDPDETIEIDGDRKSVDLWIHYEDGSRSLADSYTFAEAMSVGATTTTVVDEVS